MGDSARILIRESSDFIEGNPLALTYTVKVENGIIRLPPGVILPDGTEVLLVIPDALLEGSLGEPPPESPRD